MIRLRAVGECVIEVGSERVGPDAEVAFALLLLLVLARGRPVGRRQLVDLLWPASSEARARHNLRQSLYKLRQLGVPVTTESNQVRLAATAVAPDLLLDGELDGPPPAELLRPDVPFGEFLAGYAPAFSAPFAAWVEEQRGVMHARLRRAVLALLLDERRRGSWGAVETLARKCLQLDPLNEEATLALAEATALTGSKHAALAILDGYLRELGDTGGDIRLPATVLRRRIADHLLPNASLALAESCFVGREESVALLYEHFRRAAAEGGRSVLVWGEAGMGKSRLLAEFGRMATLEGAQVVRVGCQARDAERPLSIFVDAVPLLLAVPGALGCAPESMAYLRRLTAHDPAVLEPSAATREAELLFGYVRRAIFDLVDAVASEAPLVLCLEDVHWLDEQSWRVLRELIGWLDGRPILIVLSSRLPHATPAPPTRRAPDLVVHRLPALEQTAALALFEAVTERAPPPVTFRDWCIQVAEGNPLFLRAAGTHWIETRELRAPQSLELLVKERVLRLEPDTLRVLQGCAILGSVCTFDYLSRTLELKPSDLLNAIAVLEEDGLMVCDRSGIRCRHSLVSQAAISSLSRGTKLLLHRCAALALEAAVRQSGDAALLWSCIQQWHATGEHGRALSLARSCTAHMLELGLPRLAADTSEDLLDQCETNEERVSILGDLTHALRSSGQWERLARVLEERRYLHELLAPSDSRHSEHELLALEASLRTGADLRDLLEHAESCTGDRNSTPEHRVEAAALALLFADNMFDAEAIERIYSRICALLESKQKDQCTVLRIHAMYHNALGDVSSAVAATDEWLALEMSSADPARLSRALRNATIPYRTAGLIDRAFDAALEAFRMAAKYQLASGAANSADVLATLNLTLGDEDNARLWLDRAGHWSSQTEERIAATSIRRVEIRLALLQGRAHEAQAMLAPDISSLTSNQVARSQVETYALLAWTLVQLGRTDAIEGLLPSFRRLYERARHFHGQDLSTASLALALRAVGNGTDAARLLDEYVSTLRRDRGAMSVELQRATKAMCRSERQATY